jgi:hypothetical protein
MRKSSVISSVAVIAVASILVAVLIGIFATVEPVAAITVELAKKCRQMAINSHPPPIPPGNKAYGEAERSFFQECVKKNGDMGDGASPQDKGSPGGSENPK